MSKNFSGLLPSSENIVLFNILTSEKQNNFYALGNNYPALLGLGNTIFSNTLVQPVTKIKILKIINSNKYTFIITNELKIIYMLQVVMNL
jgi:hypothetical protein